MVFKGETLIRLTTSKQRDFTRYLFERRRRLQAEKEIEQLKQNALELEKLLHEATKEPSSINKRALKAEIYRQNQANKKHKREKEGLLQTIIELRKKLEKYES